MILRKIIISLLVIAAVAAILPAGSAKADSEQVLLVYNDKEQKEVISDLIKACGMDPVSVDSVDYSSEMIKDYEYVVLQDAAPLEDVLQYGKRPVCLGYDFKVIPGVKTGTVTRNAHAVLEVYNNTQSVIIGQGFSYIESYSGEAVGSISFEGEDHPIGIVTEKIMYAPYLSSDDISAFAVAKMLNIYFNNIDGGKMYVMVDAVYPFDDIDMLELTADKLYDNGIPFVMSVMPVYYNTDYPSFKRYASALRYIQSRSGSFIMHDALVTGNELVGDELGVRLENAYKAFEENGVNIFEETTYPYEVSLDLLAGIRPQNELFVSLPIDTIIKFEVFEDEEELDAAINTLNNKWLQIGDYRRNHTDDEYIFEETEINGDYVYKESEEKSFTFLVNTGNQALLVIVLISSVIIIVLMIFGYRLYREKFLRKRK